MLGHDTSFYFWLGQVISDYVMLGLVVSDCQVGSGYVTLGQNKTGCYKFCQVRSG